MNELLAKIEEVVGLDFSPVEPVLFRMEAKNKTLSIADFARVVQQIKEMGFKLYLLDTKVEASTLLFQHNLNGVYLYNETQQVFVGFEQGTLWITDHTDMYAAVTSAVYEVCPVYRQRINSNTSITMLIPRKQLTAILESISNHPKSKIIISRLTPKYFHLLHTCDLLSIAGEVTEIHVEITL